MTSSSDATTRQQDLIHLSTYLSIIFLVILVLLEAIVVIKVPLKFYDNSAIIVMIAYTLIFAMKAGGGLYSIFEQTLSANELMELLNMAAAIIV
jgi:hypothetical protein